ncbi:MAG: bifunctional [glutamate--ammonia ligase]-adenylyl-L-tyrosine phosphorylase/[glutamate--ammonia-ligase] adenylyltransferase, partial [Burkholderiales bacterium]|nr:bifunctional [glutamate--ammonia ligase]-adenylyl-L-tyrosine phosphorylase/[glutamate--ammonia-ligase] adenylyltransferase [Burkholderiales bacterium]
LAADPFGEAFDAGQMRRALDGLEDADEAALDRALRRLRRAVMLRLIVRDLAGWADLAEVVAGATSLAEETVAAALRWHDRELRKTYGDPIGEASGAPLLLHVVGMGKLGGGELNVSSDVDLVFVYPEAGETTGPQVIEAHEYFQRLGRKVIAALHEITDDGFVFRVDMRLRPYGDSGPLAVSLDMLEAYLTDQGRAWERYAWVKGRVLTGDRHADLMEIVTPFVYRRHLDFGAIQSMREMHAQIRAEVQRRDRMDDIKVGPGGIREIEFTAQVFQLIRGGRDPRLRVRPTLEALSADARLGWLPPETAAALKESYGFLRALEHRLQYLDDQQTQRLPGSDEDRALVADAMGFADFDALLTVLDRHRERVAITFEALFAESRTPGDGDALDGIGSAAPADGTMQMNLGQLGFAAPQAVLDRIEALQGSARFQRMSATGQSLVGRLLPRLLRAAADFPPADTTFERLIAIVESIGRRESYLSLLLEYPQALDKVARLVSLSAWACDYLAQHPVLLDELVDPRQAPEPDWAALATELQGALKDAPDNTERQMELLRHFKHAQTFRLLALDLDGALTLERLSDHLSDLAVLLLRTVVDLTWPQVRNRHREHPRFAVVGYGKLGGKELGYASDLDIIFLYDDDHPDAAENYARLAQRINTWLTSYTGAGVLYDTDLRLRPDGASGLLVSRIDAFEAYQREQAWVWEHQALTRARFVAGDAAIGELFERLRVDILRLPRPPDTLRAEVIAMRDKMRDGHPNSSGRFDLKHDAGGIVDVEFAVQFLVLAHAHDHIDLTANSGNIALLRTAGTLDLIPADLAVAAGDAYREYRRRQHSLRLRGETYARTDDADLSEKRETVHRLWRTVFGTADPAG